MSGINIARLERELGFLSRTDRKAAIEQLQQLVREVSFDLAAGASHEVECCPRCGSIDFIKKGKSPGDGSQRYFCYGCSRTFGAKTANAIGMSKLPLSTWMAFIECFVDALPLRACAQKCAVCLSSAFYMRHRLLEVIRRFCAAFTVDAGASAELDETYFRESFKGNHCKSTVFVMPRPPHKRGRSLHKPGSSAEQICVLSGVNNKGAAFFELAGRGTISKARALSALRDKVRDGFIIATDRAGAYSPVLRELNVAAHKRYDAAPRKRTLLSQGTINRINAVHAHLKLFMARFRGVATKHLHAYLVWQRWRMDFATDAASAPATLAGQLAQGVYQSARAKFFNRPALYMDYWEKKNARFAHILSNTPFVTTSTVV